METRYSILHSKVGATASKIEYDDGILRILCVDREEKALATIEFENVLLLRLTDEGTRLRLLTELAGRHGLVVVDNESPLMQWIQEESRGTRDLRSARHYLIFSGEEVMDIVSLVQPAITTGRERKD
jgi:hypothetical protein